MSALSDAKLLVSQGSRILAAQGVLDAFGHVSCRSAESADRFLISRNLAPALVDPADVVEVDLDGNIVGAPSDTRLFLERFIHGEIYRARPDVHAVVHSHALPVLPFTVVTDRPVRPICHMCGFLDGTPAPFDLADHAGPASDLLVSSSQLGANLATHLGSASVVLMRSHGYTVVGSTVQQAVYRAVYTMRNCEIDLSARSLGEPIYLSPEEAATCERTIGTQIARPWQLWLDQLEV